MTRYSIVEFGLVPGSLATRAMSINNHGHVVGHSSHPGDYKNSTGFHWEDGRISLLSLPQGNVTHEARQINDRNTIIGDVSVKVEGARFDRLAQFQGPAHNLQVVTQPHSQVLRVCAINGKDQTIGWSKSIPAGNGRRYSMHRSLFCDQGVLTEIAVDIEFNALALNDHAEVAGMAIVGETWREAAIWHRGQVTEIGTLGTWSKPQAMNNAGDVIGTSGVTEDLDHGFLWRNGTLIDLDDSAPSSVTDPAAINNHGTIVGRYYDTSGDKNSDYAFIWNDGHRENLNNVVEDRQGWQLEHPLAINDYGQVLCLAVRGNETMGMTLLLNPS